MDGASYSRIEGNRSGIDPHYVKGDVFKRDDRFYDQLIDTRRNRSGNKRSYDRSRSRSRSQGKYGRSRIDEGSRYDGSQYGGNGGSRISRERVQRVQYREDDQTRRLRQQNAQLSAELQRLSYGGDFGTGDEVIKKQHYTASHQQNQTIRNQQIKVRQLHDIIRLNNERLIKYQRAINELETRVNNVQSIDKQIHRQLKGASMRDKELLERAGSALYRGQSKQEITRILEQIIIT